MISNMQQRLSSFWSKRTNKIITCFAAAAIFFIAFVCAMTLAGGGIPEAFAGQVEINAAEENEYGMNAAEGFIITAGEPLTDDLVKKAFVSSPEFEYTLKRENEGKSYKILPKEPLSANEVYRLTFDPARALAGQPARAENAWAFQTQKDFTLQGSIPADQGKGVPLNAAVQLTFTKEPAAKEAEKKISISPETDGIWEQQGAQLTFLPKEELAEDCVYTVTIEAGFSDVSEKETISEPITFQFQTKTPERQGFPYQIQNEYNCYRTDEIPSFQFWEPHDSAPSGALKVSVYAFGGREDYLTAFRSRQPEYYWCEGAEDVEIDLRLLTEQVTFSGELDENYRLALPKKLPAGFYLVEFSEAGGSKRSLFQVTDLSGYFVAGAKDALIWLNDVSTGKPVSDAKVSLYGTEGKGTTDETGTALLQSTAQQMPILVADSGEAELVLGGWSYGYRQEEGALNPYDYWSYLYLDKELYAPGDVMRFFGVMSPKKDGGKAYSEGELFIKGGSYWDDLVLSKKIEIKDGVISGEWELPILNSGWYWVSLEVEGESIASGYFSVRYYEKPRYQFKMESDRRVAEAGDEVTWEAFAGYFEGTPLPNLKVTLYGNNRYSGEGESGKKLTTDQNGKTSATFTMPQGEKDRLFSGFYVNAGATLPEIGDVSAYDGISILNHNIEILGEVDRKKDEFTLHLTGYDVDITGISEDEQFDAKEYRRSLTGSHDISAKLVRIEYEETKEGPFYNTYTLQTYYTYRYTRREVTESNFSVNLTADGAEHTGRLEKDCAYTLILSGKDHKGRGFERTYYIGGNAPEDSDGYRYYYLSETKCQDQDRYAAGDALRYVVMNNDREVAKPERGNILYYRSQETIRDYALSEDGAYEMTFAEKDIPNVNLTAICFDGRYYTQSVTRYIMFDPADKAAKLEIKTDKQRYAPGDTVTMTLDMTDKKGKPLAGTVNINLVDEALLAIAEQYVNFGDALFGRYYDTYYNGNASHLPVDKNRDGAEMGDGGGDERELFSDTAFFDTIKTDAKGHAEVTFTLPDNITSWRIIWHAFSPGVYAGSGSKNIEASLDFFLDFRFADRYLKGDAPALGLRSAGRGIDGGSTTAYTVRVPSPGMEKSVSGTAGVWQEIPLPALAEGKHTIKISAENGEYKDAVSLDFTVTESFATYDKTVEQRLTKGLQPEGSALRPTTLVFSDEAYNTALSALYGLAWSEGVRVEQNLAGYLAGQMLTERFGMDYFTQTEEEKEARQRKLAEFQKGGGGIAAFSYGEADPETSALAASVGKERFDCNALSYYFHEMLQREELSDNDRVFCLWGLAALGEPALLELDQMRKKPDIPLESRVSLAMALYYAGDGAAAKKLTAQILQDSGETAGGIYIIKEEDKALRAKTAARLAMLSGTLGMQESKVLVASMQENAYGDNPFLLEKLGIAMSSIDRLPPKKASFSYTLEGETVAVDLTDQCCYSLTLLPEQLAEIKFSEINGTVTLFSCYRAEGQPPKGEGAEKLIAMKRTIAREEDAAVLMQDGSVTIVLEYSFDANAPNGCYSLVDFLPVGLSFGWVTSSYDKGYLLEEDGSRLVFGVYKRSEDTSGRITYTAYPTMTGSFTADAPYFFYRTNQELLVNGTPIKVTIQ